MSPEDVGSRVTFQYELPNGYISEVVGMFERWDAAADAYVLVDREGRLVSVPRQGVRYGRVVTAPPPIE